MTRTRLAAALLGLWACSTLLAIDGKAVSFVTTTSPERATLMLYTISGDAVTASDAIHECVYGWNSSLSFDGSRIAFMRKFVESGETKYRVSVIDANAAGTNLRDLVAIQKFGNLNNLDWPNGRWIYYHRPDTTYCCTWGSGEVWRVNVNDPTENYLVADYTLRNDPGRTMWRFQMSASGEFATSESQGFYDTDDGTIGIIPHRFQPSNEDPLKTYVNAINSAPARIWACNSAMSSSGEIIYHFEGGHGTIYAKKWDQVADTLSDRLTIGTNAAGGLRMYGDLDNWIPGVDLGNEFEYNRGAVNSDKWVLSSLITGNWKKQVLINWVDKKAILPSNSQSHQAETGDLWIDGGAQNSGKYEDVNGNWVAIGSTGVYVEYHATGSNPYEVTMTSLPPGCDIYYTVDGSEPTQSSTHYSGPFPISVPDDQTIVMKAKAFKAGETPSRAVAKRFVPFPECGSGITIDVWDDIPGDLLEDLTSDSRFPDNPDTSKIALSLGWYAFAYPHSTQGQNNWYGYRIRGYLIAPMTGTYRFNLMSWGESSVRLGTSSDPSSAVEILTTRQMVDPARMPEAEVQLQGGRHYYIEVLLKSGNYSDQMNVAWQLPWGEWENPVHWKRLLPFGTVSNNQPGPDALRRSGSAIAMGAGKEIVVHDALGNVVARSTSRAAASLPRVPAGIYFVTIGDGRHTSTRRVVVKGNQPMQRAGDR